MFKQKKTTQHTENEKQQSSRLLFSRRVVIVLLAMFISIAILLSRAYYLQINRHAYYKTRSRRNRVRSEVIPPLRGNIYDRYGTPLSENILSYDVVMNRAHYDAPDEMVRALSNYMRFDEDDWQRYLSDKKKKHYNQNVIVRSDLTEKEMARFLVDLYRFPGFDVVPSYTRYYPHGDLTAHVVGYINNINAKDLAALDPKEYSGTQKIGRTGIEKAYESVLHGKAGYRQAEISRTGKVVRILDQKDPVPGQDLYLSLDLPLQQILKDVLESDTHNGAAVAIDPRNGEVLAMYSNPSFDANLFVNGISHDDYQKLLNSPDKNLFNRALNGSYSPASTIKPMMVLAAMHDYIVNYDTEIDCTGSYRIPDYENTKRFFCWKRSGHGQMTAGSSIIESCDVYYYNIGKELGINRIHSYLSQFGLGEKTGIDLPNEFTGILPNRSWKRERHKMPWFIGDTVNASIGQGYMITTPLQLSYFTAVLAARGQRYQPHFVTHYRDPETGQKLEKVWATLPAVKQNNPRAWDVVSKALVDVMYAKKGTGSKIRVNLPFKIAGKTGTAQVFSFRNEQRIKKDDLSKELRDNSVFIAYAPADNPVIAISVILENAGGGSEAAAPLAVHMLERFFVQRKKQEANPQKEESNPTQAA